MPASQLYLSCCCITIVGNIAFYCSPTKEFLCPPPAKMGVVISPACSSANYFHWFVIKCSIVDECNNTTVWQVSSYYHSVFHNYITTFRLDNEALMLSSPYRQLHWAHMTFVNSALLLNPSRLMFDYRMGAIPLVRSFLDARNLLTVLTISSYFLLGLYSVHAMHWRQTNSREQESSLSQATVNDPGIITSQRRHCSNKRILLFGLALMAIPYVPASNLFFPVGFVVAERVLYLPSMGLCLCAAHGIWRLHSYYDSFALKSTLKLFLVFLLLTFSVKTFVRNQDWESNVALYTAGAKVNPKHGVFLTNLGIEHGRLKNFSFAEALYRQSMKHAPLHSRGYSNFGGLMEALKRYDEAEQVVMVMM